MSFIGTAVTATVATGVGFGVNALLSGDGGGFSPASSISMTPGGKKLETGLYESLKTDLFPENLASKFVGDAKKMFQVKKRAGTKAIAGAGATGPESIVSGSTGKGLLAETGFRLGEAAGGERKVGQAKRGFALERLNKLQNFINLQSGSSVIQAQADLIKGEQDQLQGARTGAGIGSIAQLLAVGATY